MTVSVGAVSVIPEATITARALVSADDDLLYLAKEDGRNRGIHLDMQSNTRVTLRASELEAREFDRSAPRGNGGFE